MLLQCWMQTPRFWANMSAARTTLVHTCPNLLAAPLTRFSVRQAVAQRRGIPGPEASDRGSPKSGGQVDELARIGAGVYVLNFFFFLWR